MSRFAVSVLILFALVLTGCWLTTPFEEGLGSLIEIQGASIVRHGMYLYTLGGTDLEGEVTARTYMARITESPLQWTETTPLPAGRAFGSAFSAGNMMYYMGGTDGSTDSSSIYYTYIDPTDGTLGFPAGVKFWEANPIALPRGLSHFGYALYDGRIYLLGGISDSEKIDTIFEARIHDNNLIGQWYASPHRLPSAISDLSTTIFNDALVIAGGIDGDGNVIQKVVSYPLGLKGIVCEGTILPDLQKPLASAVLFGNGPDLIILGGYDENFNPSDSVFALSDSASWQHQYGYSVTAAGPSVARISKQIWYLGHNDELVDLPRVGNLESDTFLPDSPNVFPGSGFVTKNSNILALGEPGSILKYRRKGDLDWMAIPVPFRILEDVEYEFSSDPDSEHAREVRAYQVRSLGFLFSISGSLSIQEGNPLLEKIYLRSSIFDAESNPVSSVWVKLRLFDDENLLVTFEDQTSEAHRYTGNIRLSLFEDDFNTEALDIEGMPVSERSVAQGPLLLSLQKGEYYFLLEDINSSEGTSLGIAVGRP